MNLYESLQLTKKMTAEDKIEYSDAMFVSLNDYRFTSAMVSKYMPIEIACKILSKLEKKYSEVTKEGYNKC